MSFEIISEITRWTAQAAKTAILATKVKNEPPYRTSLMNDFKP